MLLQAKKYKDERMLLHLLFHGAGDPMPRKNIEKIFGFLFY
jgi:hypothetical protein